MYIQYIYLINALLEKITVLHFAVKSNCLVKVILCLDGCANCFENKYIVLEKSVKSTEKNRNQNQNQLYSPSVCKHTRNLLWFLRSSWYIHAYIHTYIHTYI